MSERGPIDDPMIQIPVGEPSVPPPVLEPVPPELLEPAEFAFTKKQREAILERDGHRCQATCKHRCNQEKGIEVDHIMPQRWCYDLGIDPDFAQNGLSKCKNSHNIKHPDRISALQTYRAGMDHGVDTFKEMFEVRNQLLNNKQIYWNDANDRTDLARAVQLTQRAVSRGWEFPAKGRQQ